MVEIHYGVLAASNAHKTSPHQALSAYQENTGVGLIDPQVHFGDISLRPSCREIICHGSTLKVKKISFRMLTLLVHHSERVVTRKEIFKGVWGFDFDTGTKRIEVQLHYLRCILKQLNSSVIIMTYRGTGLGLHYSTAAEGGSDSGTKKYAKPPIMCRA
ncbi:winged helix-turn-helix domain-containing protein [Pseudomonas sp. NPDC089547]|uniref:winged helix-turn-helix domain-containing protein n=1 Tax=Pseudomonas sp. NPDC089547 TaxID=3390652 RepID=UPI003CFF75B1